MEFALIWGGAKIFAVEGSSTHSVCVEYTGAIRRDNNRMEVTVEWCFLAKILKPTYMYMYNIIMYCDSYMV